MEPNFTDVQFASVSSTTSRIGISISLTFGRASKACAGFGICKADVNITLKQASSGNTLPANKIEGYVVENSNGDYLRLDLASLIDTTKFDTAFYVDNDIEVVINGAKRYLAKGVYYPLFDSNKNGSYYITLK